MIYRDTTIVNNPIISICIPTYNQEKYISETLESVLRQKLNIPCEIIIADDCSTDATSSICQAYQRKYPQKIIFISNEKNRGLLSNLFYVLFAAARGDYIAVCAGDDVWIKSSKLKEQYNLLKKNSHISLVHTGYNKY
ncbi:MAG: glycosyltransferase, partial [Bacteroidetes bacterium]|nr:glycosyltransferase [Bacteroidota bacterium]